ncbi:MAG: hypothetical protein DMF40_12720 [Verrucomicrobia bacterium]|nr:MAG: hypothetical protein DME38_09745 [Verrucomicrobiota bacterium]PYL46349.1 MAG: hypothetical protein DMF40_12720 [Verrucomicrobiota bacterium]
MKRLSRGLRALADCAPIENTKAPDHRMRTAVSRAKRTEDFGTQQAFDRAVAKLVEATPVSSEIRHWFANEKMAEGTKRSWRKTAFHPAILAIGIALAVIAVVVWIKFAEQMHAFPGTATAKKLLNVAAMTRPSEFEPVQTEAGTLNDLFFMKYRLEHYDVPREFSQQRTIGVRKFDDEEAGQVAQIGLAEKRMQLFLFPAPRDSKTGKPEEFAGWRYIEQEGWTGAVQVRNGILFMAAVRGTKKDLAPYLAK